MKIKKKKVRINFGLEIPEIRKARKEYRRAHSSKSDIITMHPLWISFLRELWFHIRSGLKRNFPSPGRGEDIWISLIQFCELTELTWGEARGLYQNKIVFYKSTTTGSKRDTDYLPLKQYPQLANYMVRLFDNGQLKGRHWDCVFIETGIHSQPFKQIRLDEAIEILRSSIRKQEQ